MELFSKIYEIVICILNAIYHLLFSFTNEGFVSLPGLRKGNLSLYPVKEEVSSVGGDNRYRMFEPYLRQTELSHYEQKDNHRWPTGRTLAGSMEQSLSSAPVLPCEYPRPKVGGERLHTKEDALARNKLTYSSVDF